MEETTPGRGVAVATALMLGAVSGVAAQLTGEVQVQGRACPVGGLAALGVATGSALLALGVGVWLARARSAGAGVAAALGALVAAVVAQRWLASAKLGAAFFPLTAWLWDAFSDERAAVLLVLPLFFVSLALDVLLMMVSVPGASVMPYAVLVMAPACGALAGVAVSALVRRVSGG